MPDPSGRMADLRTAPAPLSAVTRAEYEEALAGGQDAKAELEALIVTIRGEVAMARDETAAQSRRIDALQGGTSDDFARVKVRLDELAAQVNELFGLRLEDAQRDEEDNAPATRLSAPGPELSQRERIAELFGWRRGTVSDAQQREISLHLGPLWVRKDGHKNGWMVPAGAMDDGRFAAALHDANEMIASQDHHG